MALRVSSWIDKKEWCDVRDMLYSDDRDLRRRGIGWVSMWESRERLPVSVSVTRSLVEALDCDSCTTDVRRNALGLALIRLVNGLVDDLQGVQAVNIRVLAQRLGLPGYFIDIRHEVTHGVMPTEVMLEEVGRNALSWLYHAYWSIADDLSNDFVATEETLQKLREDHGEAAWKVVAATLEDDDWVITMCDSVSNKLDFCLHVYRTKMLAGTLHRGELWNYLHKVLEIDQRSSYKVLKLKPKVELQVKRPPHIKIPFNKRERDDQNDIIVNDVEDENALPQEPEVQQEQLPIQQEHNDDDDDEQPQKKLIKIDDVKERLNESFW